MTMPTSAAPCQRKRKKKKDEQKFKSTKAKPQLGATIVGRGIHSIQLSVSIPFLWHLCSYIAYRKSNSKSAERLMKTS